MQRNAITKHTLQGDTTVGWLIHVLTSVETQKAVALTCLGFSIQALTGDVSS